MANRRGRPAGSKNRKTIEREIQKAQVKRAKVLEKQLTKITNFVANETVQMAAPAIADSVTEIYKEAMDYFYNDYTPTTYQRTDFLRNYSYQPYTRVIPGGRGRTEAGVIISADRYPYNPYSADADYVVHTAYYGSHGPFMRPGRSHFVPMRYMYQRAQMFLNGGARYSSPRVGKGRVDAQMIIEFYFEKALKIYSARNQK